MSHNFCHNWPTELHLVVTESSSQKYSILNKNSVELEAKYLEDAIMFIHTRDLLSIHYFLSDPSFNNPWHIIDTNTNNANAINCEAAKSVTNSSADLIRSVENCKLLATAKVIQVSAPATVDWNLQPQVHNVFIIILAPKIITGVCNYVFPWAIDTEIACEINSQTSYHTYQTSLKLTDNFCQLHEPPSS